MLAALSRFSHSLPSSRTKVRLGRVLSKLIAGSNSIVEITMRDDIRMVLDARSRTEAEAIWNGEYDSDEIDFFKACLSPGDVFFDVGANVGLITVPIGRYLKESSGRVISFEPVDANFKRLVQVIRLNDLVNVVTPFNLALGDEEGEIEMAMECAGGASTGNALRSNVPNDPAKHAVTKARITRLDGLATTQKIERVDFIKVDIEGAEVSFLRGAQELITRKRPYIYGEFNSAMMPAFGHSFMDVAEVIKPWNYRIFAFKSRLSLEEVEPRVGLGNVVLVPAEKVEELTRRVMVA